ncbi:glycosyltransferase family 2 protein, partial [Enterococcus faecium]|uniref:glycosyltransferase family 2 protein n=1 Tax=Enterococcus faecium TaxID=1352 RepID=UPI003F4432B2
AVTAAALMVRADSFASAGGFDPVHLAVAFNDVDLCLRLSERGLKTIYEPAALFAHVESASRGAVDESPRFAAEVAYMQKRWSPRLTSDPWM